MRKCIAGGVFLQRRHDMKPSVIEELKQLIAGQIAPNGVDVQKLGPEDALFSEEGFFLDSIDAVELIALLQDKYGVSIENVRASRDVFNTLGSLADYIEKNRTK